MPRKQGNRRKTSTPKKKWTILGVDSNYDGATKIGFDYRTQHLYPYLKRKGYSVMLFQGEAALRKHVAPQARKKSVRYITGISHGTTTSYIGEDRNPIFEVNKYSPEEAEGKIVHLVSCETAQKLGPDFINNRCQAYFGYDHMFTFHRDTADIFFKFDSEIDRGFAAGLTAEQVHAHLERLCKKYIAQLQNDEREHIASTLITNLSHLCRLGDGNAKLS